MAQAQTHLPATSVAQPRDCPLPAAGTTKAPGCIPEGGCKHTEAGKSPGVGGSQAVSGDKELREGGQAFPTRVVPGQTHDNDRN